MFNRRRFLSLVGGAAFFAASARAHAQAGAIAKGKIVFPGDFGAVGDGLADDTAAFQRALDSLQAGDTLVVAAGATFRHTDVLRVRRAGVRVIGPGTLLATNEEKSALSVEANDVTLEGGLGLRIQNTTRRFDAPDQNKLHIAAVSGAVVRGVFVDGSAAAGVFLLGASNFLLEDVTVQDTRADGIHNTFGAHDGLIRRAAVRNVGDDGIAVVSYGADPATCHHIAVESPRFHGNKWGRGFSVVGGQDITLRDVLCENSNAAAIYIAVEGAPWNTRATRRVQILGGTLARSNQSATVDHGAILIYNARPDLNIEDVLMSDLILLDTSPRASRQVGILVGASGGARDIELRNFTIRGGPSNLFVSDAPASGYKTTNWNFNGVARPDHAGAPAP